ncbi:hypothetical protein H072_807 [Dactylellina haptotyla CBS 200.50]|uniref:Chromo domain-containing protein n=1 Tax=Dactylellina haptotyla (strain CBS 200.50) TaxID=1284197 RepID=S8AW91_DACHA|nr:hypothetical protein H072_807 [Dactylellina haptotyla CBS 200.50]
MSRSTEKYNASIQDKRNPELDIVDDENNFDVECIVVEKEDHRSGRQLYLVNWKGFEEKDFTWEPREHFHDQCTLADWDAFKKKTAEYERFNWRVWDRTYGDDSTTRSSQERDLKTNLTVIPRRQNSKDRTFDEVVSKLAGGVEPTLGSVQSNESDDASSELLVPEQEPITICDTDSPSKYRRSKADVVACRENRIVQIELDQEARFVTKDNISIREADACLPSPDRPGFDFTVVVNEEGFNLRAGYKHFGFSPAFKSHLEKRGITEFVINGFIGFQCLENTFVKVSGVPTEHASMEGLDDLSDAFFIYLSELRGAALVLESSFTMILAPSHAQKFHHLFHIPTTSTSKLTAVVYPPLQGNGKPAYSPFVLPGLIFFGGFVLGGISNCIDLQSRPFRKLNPLQIYALPSAQASSYSFEILLLLNSYWQKTGGVTHQASSVMFLFPEDEILSQRAKWCDKSPSLVLLIHRSLLRSLHLIPNLALLRSLNKNSFYVFGPGFDFGTQSLGWDINPLFPHGGVLLLTLELLLHEPANILRAIQALGYNFLPEETSWIHPESKLTQWAFAMPENLIQVLGEALEMRAVHKRLSAENIENSAKVLEGLRILTTSTELNKKYYSLNVATQSNINYTEICVDAFVRFQIEASAAYRSFVIICGAGLIDKRSLERQYTNLNLVAMSEFLKLLDLSS